jgi:hypothetical protein
MDATNPTLSVEGLDKQSLDPFSAKNIFKRNVIALASKLGIEPTELAKGSHKFGRGAHRSYMSKLLSEKGELQNFTLDVAESISKVLGKDLHQMVNPNFDADQSSPSNYAPLLNEELLMESLATVRSIAAREGIKSYEFETKLVSYLYYAKVNKVAESDRYAEVSRLSRMYING